MKGKTLPLIIIAIGLILFIVNDSFTKADIVDQESKAQGTSYNKQKEGSHYYLLKNMSFEKIIPDKGDNGNTSDPVSWFVVEGKTEKGTYNVIKERPELIQVVSNENGVSPYKGNKMVKIDARLYVKTNIRQYYASTINEGILVQQIALYPLSDEYLQQIEIRGDRDKDRGYRGNENGNENEEEGVRGNQLFALKYSHEKMLLVVTTGEEVKNGRHIVWKEFPPLPAKQWSKIRIILEKVDDGKDEKGTFSQFKLTLYINGKLLYQSGRQDEPYIQFFKSADFIVIGDDYVLPEDKSPEKNKMTPTAGDSYGIVYYDGVYAWKVK
jgi:hypothetical protein